MCVHAPFHTYVCFCVCICAHRFACMYVCACRGAWMQMCAHAGVGACTYAWTCVVSDPASSPPWKPSVGIGLHALLILKLWCSWCCCFWTPCCRTTGCCWTITDSLPRGTRQYHKNNCSYYPGCRALDFRGLEGQLKVTFRPLIQTVYIRIYTKKLYIYVLYGVYISRLKFTYGVYEYGYGENLFIHKYIYGTYIYTAYIYIYGLGQPCIYTVRPRSLLILRQKTKVFNNFRSPLRSAVHVCSVVLGSQRYTSYQRSAPHEFLNKSYNFFSELKTNILGIF